jgi:hypothetical protein
MTTNEREQHYSTWGKSFIVIGAIMIVFGVADLIYVTLGMNFYASCPSGGCGSPSASQLFDFYLTNGWTGIVLISLGLVFCIAGIRYVTKSHSTTPAIVP